MPFPAVVDLADIAAGMGGFKIESGTAGDGAGGSVSGAGDVNGDAIDDVVVSASGAAYIVFGRASSFTSPVDLEAIAAGNGGFKIHGESTQSAGIGSVSDAGDVNGDGIDDLIVGAPGDSGGGLYAGAAYVIFGTTGAISALVDLDDIAEGTGGFKIEGENTYDFAGAEVSGAGDVNGDGIDDLIIGAFGEDSGGMNAGAAYIVFGSSGGFSTPVDLTAIAAGTGGFKVIGEKEDDYAGVAVSSAGDINGDGIDDLIIGGATFPYRYDYRGASAAYIVFGRTEGFMSPVDLGTIASGTGGFKIGGESPYGITGYSVSEAGDINGDGIGDVIVGDPESQHGHGGSAYVLFGSTDEFAASISLDDIAAGRGGFKIQGTSDYGQAGVSVAAAGDINGDGIDDIIVGHAGYDNDDLIQGSAYVVFGRADGFASPVDLEAVALGSGGFEIPGEVYGDEAGSSVSGAGDVNGDGIDDLIIGAPNHGDDFTYAGAAYVIFGRRDGPLTLFTEGDDVRDLNDFDLSLFPGILATDALAGDDTVTLSETQNLSAFFDGNAGADTIIGSSHRDRVHGGDDDDVLRGGRGWDQLEGGFGDDTIYGGVGDDRIVGQWGSNQLWGGDGAETFVCGGSPGLETVNDFEVGIDKVEVRSQGRGVEITFDAGSDATLILLDGIGPIVQLLGVQAGSEDLVVI